MPGKTVAGVPKVVLDNVSIEVPEGSTILQAARLAGIEIPTLCYLDCVEPQTSCLVCVVRVNGGQRLVPACATRVAEGMVVESSSPAVHQARKTALELLLSEHAGECFAPCSQVCPAHLDIPGMIEQVRQDQWESAAAAVREALVLPTVLGYVCPGLCEKGCRRGSADGAVSICQMHRAIGEQDLASGKPWLPVKAAATGKRVAIIGSGPAGLAAAYELLKAGHACTMFEARPLAGGTLRYGLEEGKLPAGVLDAEIDLIAQLGAEFRLGVEVGKEISFEELGRAFDAVAVTGGGGKAPAGQGVFVSISAASARPHAVQAVADGRALAQQVHAYLSAHRHVPQKRFAVRLGAMNEQEMARFMAEADPRPPTTPAAGPAGPFTKQEAQAEASRCQLCGCGSLESCRLRRYAQEHGAEVVQYRGQRKELRTISTHPDLVFEEGKCILCGLCVAIARQAGEPLGLSFVSRGFDVRVSAPLGRTWAEALTNAAEEAARACPTGAIHRKARRQIL